MQQPKILCEVMLLTVHVTIHQNFNCYYLRSCIHSIILYYIDFYLADEHSTTMKKIMVRNPIYSEPLYDKVGGPSLRIAVPPTPLSASDTQSINSSPLVGTPTPLLSTHCGHRYHGQKFIYEFKGKITSCTQINGIIIERGRVSCFVYTAVKTHRNKIQITLKLPNIDSSRTALVCTTQLLYC